MSRSTMKIEAAHEILDYVRDVARDGNRSVESVVHDVLAILYGKSYDSDIPLESLAELDDEQLWAVANRHLSWAQDSRRRELVERGKLGIITGQESNELDNLTAAVDRLVLLRSKALVLMKQRGHDIDAYLGIEA